MKLIYNGRPSAPAAEKKAPHSTAPRIVSVGRLAWPKQPGQLLHFLVKQPEVRLDLVGDGPHEQATQELAEKLGVADRVTFHGHVDDIYPILRQADIFALVSDWEGFPMSTLEAMSAGLPTVVSSVGGAPEAVEHGVTGYQVPRGDEQALHKYLTTLIADTELRLKMGDAARCLFEEKFRLDTMVGETLAFYSDVHDR